MAFKKSGAESSKKSNKSEETNSPCAHMFGAVKNGEGWEEERITGMFLDIKIPTEKGPDGAVRLTGKVKEEIVIPAGTILKIKLNGTFEKLGLKAIVNEDGDVSFEQV